MNSENQTGVQSPMIIDINLHIPEITITKKMRQGVKRELNVIHHEVDESVISDYILMSTSIYLLHCSPSIKYINAYYPGNRYLGSWNK